MTGYDLKCSFRDTIGAFYQVSDGALYPALKNLARDGMVRMRPDKRGRRKRKVYSITGNGRAWFLARLGEPSPEIVIHDEAAMKLYFGHHRPEAALEHLRRMQRFDAEKAAALEQVTAEIRKRETSPFRIAVVEIGWQINAFKARMLEEVICRLNGETGTSPAHGKRQPIHVAANAR